VGLGMITLEDSTISFRMDSEPSSPQPEPEFIYSMPRLTLTWDMDGLRLLSPDLWLMPIFHRVSIRVPRRPVAGRWEISASCSTRHAGLQPRTSHFESAKGDSFEELRQPHARKPPSRTTQEPPEHGCKCTRLRLPSLSESGETLWNWMRVKGGRWLGHVKILF
jgi:hypothetical protein